MIPVLRPKLPTAAKLAPYLAAIDEARWYSNFGPCVRRFEERLCSHFDLRDGSITTVANATLGLTLALMAQNAPAGALCAVPAWTFVASAHAVVLAGLTPYFIDVDPSSWSLDPLVVEEEMGRAPARVGAIMVVAPFGQPIDYQAWDELKMRTGLPVVIDAAAAFDSLRVGQVPAVVSLHATKVLGVSEGGFVASRDPAIVRGVEQRSNFGFHSSRSAEMPAVNAKLSEYHAAIGLAALDTWQETRGAWLSVARHYRRTLAKSNSINLQPGFGESWVSSTCVVSFDEPSFDERAQDRVRQALAAAGIDTRMWWGRGAHAQPAAAAHPRASLPVTERLARSTLGVPFYEDLAPQEVQHIATVLIEAMSA